MARLYAAVGRLNRSLRRESTTPTGYGALAAVATVEADGPLRLSEQADRGLPDADRRALLAVLPALERLAEQTPDEGVAP